MNREELFCDPCEKAFATLASKHKHLRSAAHRGTVLIVENEKQTEDYAVDWEQEYYPKRNSPHYPPHNHQDNKVAKLQDEVSEDIAERVAKWDEASLRFNLLDKPSLPPSFLEWVDCSLATGRNGYERMLITREVADVFFHASKHCKLWSISWGRRDRATGMNFDRK